MEKTIFEKIGGEFERHGDYLIPCLALSPEKEQPIGLFGRQHLDYLKQYCKVYRLIEGMKQAQGIT